MSTAGEVRDFLDDRPDLKPAVEAVLAAEEPFTFDDLEIDSGAFGEIVSAGIAAQTEEGYVVVDRDAVQRAFENEGHQSTTDSDWRGALPTVDRRSLAALGVAIGFVILMRLLSWPAVFRDGVVVLSGNDPYYYRYWVEQLLVNPAISLDTLPDTIATGEPLLVATLWIATSLLGGTRAVAGHVMAWYPVVSAGLTAVVLYVLTVRVTADRRVGLSAVALFAVIPAHAFRTSLGFADHHAFDYPWLALTTLSLVVLVTTPVRSRRTVLGIVGVGVGVTIQTLAWDAGPLLLVPLGLTIAVWTIISVHQEVSPVERVGPTVAGIGVGAVVVWAVHSSLGWQTTLVASAPLLVVLGAAAVIATAELAHRFAISARVLIGLELVIGLGSLGLLALARPAYWAQFTNSVTKRLIREGTIAESQNLFGRSFGWLLLFGFVFVLTVPYLVWATRRALDEIRWMPVVVYGWYFLGLAVIQVRFIGELAAFAAVFAGLGFVHLCHWVDVARQPVPFEPAVDGDALPTPTRRQVGAVIVLFLLVGGLGLIQVPVKTNQVTVSEERYETARWMETYATDHDWAYPRNYVFSQWGTNRMYNYFVSGESRSYGFAQRQFEPFLTSDTPAEWYQRLNERAGFIVYETAGSHPQGSIGNRLDAFGSRTATASGLAHYRAVYVSDEGSYRVFTLVPGATITGQADAGTRVQISTEVTVEGASFTYERQVETNSNGRFSVTVPYPGEYTVGSDTVTVSEQAVISGGNVSAP